MSNPSNIEKLHIDQNVNPIGHIDWLRGRIVIYPTRCTLCAGTGLLTDTRGLPGPKLGLDGDDVCLRCGGDGIAKR